MSKTVVHIFGASGSGTSTIGRALAERLGYRFMDTDDYFWLPVDPPYTAKRPTEERLRMMREDIESSGGAVISGALVPWGNPLMPLFTLAVRVVTPTDVRLKRLEARESAEFGSRKEPGGDMYEDHLEFMAWAARYETAGLEQRSKAEHDEWEKQLPCPEIYVDGTQPVEASVEQIIEAMGDV